MKTKMTLNKIQHEGFIKLRENLHIFCRGYFIWEDQIFCNQEMVPIIAKHFTNKSIRENVNKYNGSFNLVILFNKEIYIFNDRWGVFPLYYVKKHDKFILSTDWKELLKETETSLSKAASLEMLTFGYVQGNKTLLENIDELAPHSIFHIKLKDNKIDFNTQSYWEFNYTYKNVQKSNILEKQFSDIWQKQISIYANYLREHDNLAYIPLSGGLDSRLLISYFDAADINIYTMTFGNSPKSKEIKTALEVSAHLNNILGHSLLYYSTNLLKIVFENQIGNFDQLTCAHNESRWLFLKDVFHPNGIFHIPGHDANFMAGENLKLKMRNWTTKNEIIDYILRYKSSSLTLPLIKTNPEVNELLRASLEEVIPDEPDLLAAFNRWNCEQRQRRYIIRSSIQIENDQQKIFLPFFDYEIMDFFMDLPLEMLFNQKLYINTQLTHLYNHNPTLIKIKRDGTNKLTKIRNNYWTEYYPKLNSSIRKKLSLPKKKDQQWSENTDFTLLTKNILLPDFIDTELIDLNNNWINIFYLRSISEIHSLIQEKI